MNVPAESKPIGSYPGAQSVSRAIALLKVFTDAYPVWSLGDLSDCLGLNKTTVHRLLAAMESEGLVMRDDVGGHYRLGVELIALGGSALRAHPLRAAARSELAALARETGESIVLEILVGRHTLILDSASSSDPISISQDIGARLPAHATSTGKLLLAHQPAAVVDAFLAEPLAALTSRTLTEADLLRQQLVRIRQQGYAMAEGELEIGFVSAAAPIFQGDGSIAGALSIGGPALRMTPQRMPSLVAALQVAALHISHRLGHRPGL